ncbi:DUF1992 domain-containing protein [Gordonia jinhuaensis]|uniref:DnaJ homologue subfamily C member 28 conserved domain-containing protein n=1 Tax=Gordonia jinhuaensis TaxID=1517702 RepID=A0A916SZ83_9ACTN|nr:DUF1992 domain-containing protein [Gordonia jinhuaensis]GGB24766.1 hypothetical protein GCM10011489_11230 [Gordonia jinhuaensis]
MTARKRRRWYRPTVPESRVDRLIREATERGDFDNLPGSGKPLDLSDSHDPDWWAKKKMREENLDASSLLPSRLQLRKERDGYPESVADIADEGAVRRVFEDFNSRVKRDRLGDGGLGPMSTIVVGTIDVDEMLARWREIRSHR